MDLKATYESLCNPAKFYFILSAVGFVLVLLQNLSKGNLHPMLILGNLVYIALWTWVLNMVCKINPNISWVIVLFPFVLTVVLLGYIMFIGATVMHKK